MDMNVKKGSYMIVQFDGMEATVEDSGSFDSVKDAKKYIRKSAEEDFDDSFTGNVRHEEWGSDFAIVKVVKIVRPVRIVEVKNNKSECILKDMKLSTRDSADCKGRG
jgi:hypothetical protein